MSRGPFSIRFVELGARVGRGEIVIGDFRECFESPLSYWTAEEYQRQWREGLMRILRGEGKSALVTAMRAPESANFLVWWILFRSGSEIVFRNQILFMEHLDRRFDPGGLYDFVPDRDAGDDEEYPISEWSVEFANIGSGMA